MLLMQASCAHLEGDEMPLCCSCISYSYYDLSSVCISSSVIELVLFLTGNSSFLTSSRLDVILVSPVEFSIDVKSVIQHQSFQLLMGCLATGYKSLGHVFRVYSLHYLLELQ